MAWAVRLRQVANLTRAAHPAVSPPPTSHRPRLQQQIQTAATCVRAGSCRHSASCLLDHRLASSATRSARAVCSAQHCVMHTSCARRAHAHASRQGSDAAPAPATQSKQEAIWTLPTLLTVARLFAIPPVMWLFTYTDSTSAAWASGIFVVASLTDFLDGFLARKMGTHSTFGAFLDPVADKLMVCAVLILLCTKTFTDGLFAGWPWLLPSVSVAIISRELAMSALREWAASAGPAARNIVNVNFAGKVKTTLQLVSLAMLVYAMNGGTGAVYDACATAGPWLLLGAAALTVQSFAAYFVAFARHVL